jgi:hypothetical protein
VYYCHLQTGTGHHKKDAIQARSVNNYRAADGVNPALRAPLWLWRHAGKHPAAQRTLSANFEGVEPGNWVKTGKPHGAGDIKRLITCAIERTRST